MIPVREGCSRPATQAARSYGILPCARLCIDPRIWLPSDWQPSINYSLPGLSSDPPRNTLLSTASWNWFRIGRAATAGDASASCERPSSRHWTIANHQRNRSQGPVPPLRGGYEFLRTVQFGEVHHEDRVTIDATPGFRLPGEILVRDRNWIELRWIDGAYTTTYRNQLMVERDFLFPNGFRFSPYGSAEVFYNGSRHTWNQEWYTAGIEWPYKHRLMLDTYYRRESCHGCTPTNWNAGGVTLNFYFGSAE